MEWQFEVFRRKRTDWMITWKKNRIRWIIFYYLVGLIVSCLFFFVEESLHALPFSIFFKSVCVLVLIPFLTIGLSIVRQYRRDPRAQQQPRPAREVQPS